MRFLYTAQISILEVIKHMKWIFFLACFAVFGSAYGSCGSSYCTVNTNWDTQGLSHDQGLLVDVRYAYAKADQWRSGSSAQSTPTLSGADREIENKRTINQTTSFNLDYALDQHWGITLAIPYISRDHSHTWDGSSGAFSQQAKFSELGDIRVVGRYKLSGDGVSATGVRFGVKLPTGQINKSISPGSDEGTILERSAQPGTGSTDGILGVYHYENLPDYHAGWFASAHAQSALSTRDGYRPGSEFNIDLGGYFALAENLNALLQLNANWRERDSGLNANPASGGYSVNIAPGLSYALTPNIRVYGFYQQPLKQYVNNDKAEPFSGQLVHKWAAILGLAIRY